MDEKYKKITEITELINTMIELKFNRSIQQQT